MTRPLLMKMDSLIERSSTLRRHMSPKVGKNGAPTFEIPGITIDFIEGSLEGGHLLYKVYACDRYTL